MGAIKNDIFIFRLGGLTRTATVSYCSTQDGGFTVLYCSDAMLLHLHGQCFNRITVVCVWVVFLNCITHATTCKKSLTTIIYLELSQLLCISAFSQP